MRLIKQVTKIDFMGMRKPTLAISTLLLFVSILSLGIQGLNPGIDFSGGILVEVHYEGAAPLNRIRELLKDSEFADAQVQNFGTAADVLIRLAPMEGRNNARINEQILRLLNEDGHSVSMRRIEFIGPQVGEELTQGGGLALLYALFGVLFYVAIRFEIRFSAGAILALIHDTVLVVGFFSITRMEFDLSVLAAILAVIGYSLNDTIVIYDRIRENFRRMPQSSNIKIINVSLNQTLNRTLATSLTTMLVLLSLFFLGGETVNGFSLALILGVLTGTYSSLFVACPLLLMMGVSAKHLMPETTEENVL